MEPNELPVMCWRCHKQLSLLFRLAEQTNDAWILALAKSKVDNVLYGGCYCGHKVCIECAEKNIAQELPEQENWSCSCY